MQPSCPPDHWLNAKERPELSEDEWKVLEEHLSECSRCAATLAEHDECVAMGTVLREGQVIVSESLHATPPDLITRLASLVPGHTDAEVSSADPSQTLDDGKTNSSHRDLLTWLAPPRLHDELGRLGNYRVLRVLGHGGMGVVYCAEDPKLKRLVALKAMLPALAASESNAHRFLREAEAMAAVEHDHIVRIYQIDEDRGVPFVAMELLKGESLDDRLKRSEPMELGEILRIGREIAEGLSAAHATGLIHRDIKPANIWLEAGRSRVKILDFGLARAVTNDSPATADENKDVPSRRSLTHFGAVVGTPAYMAPEQASGETIDVRTDLFSLGIVLYRMFTGSLPFQRLSTPALLKAIVRDPIPPPREINPSVPEPVEAFLMRLIAKEPNERMATANEVVDALRTLERTFERTRNMPFPGNAPKNRLGESKLGAEQTRSRAARWSHRRTVTAAVVFLAFAFFAGFFANNWSPTSTIPSPPGDYELVFDGASSVIEIPSLSRDSGDPITLEAYVTVADPKGAVVIRMEGEGSCQLYGWPSEVGSELWRFNGLEGAGLKMDSRKTEPIAMHKRVHVAFQISDNQLTLYIDGKLANTIDRVLTRRPGSFRGTHLGAEVDPTKPGYRNLFTGRMDEIRISKKVRYTQDFTPEERFTPDADTLALYHCDEGEGDRLVDASGNEHHGKIQTLKWVRRDPTIKDQAPNLGLTFDGMSHVEIPTLIRDEGDRSYTLEAWIQESKPNGNTAFVVIGGKARCQLGQAYGRFQAIDFPNGILSHRRPSASRAKHYAYVVNPPNIHLFVDGRLVQSAASGVPYDVPKSNTVDRSWIGGHSVVDNAEVAFRFIGSIDEVRVSRVARYQTNFTPETRFQVDADTLALYHCDEGEGEVLRDASNHGHHGKVVGAKWAPFPLKWDPAAPVELPFDAKHAVRFEGYDSYADFSSLVVDVDHPITVEGWFLNETSEIRINVKSSTGVWMLGRNDQKVRWGHVIGSVGKMMMIDAPSTDGWMHLAATSDGKLQQLFVDGKVVANRPTVKTKLPQASLWTSSLGATRIAAKTRELGGTVAGLRISRIVRYSAEFTPPRKFTTDDDTLVLFPMNEGAGNKLIDASNAARHATLFNAQWVKPSE